MENIAFTDNKKKLIKALDTAVLEQQPCSVEKIENPEYCKLSTGIVLIKDKELASIVNKGVNFYITIKDLEGKLSRISDSLKKYGFNSIKTWNIENEDKIKSVRLSSGEEKTTVLVSVKNLNADVVDGKKITPEMKTKLGKFYNSTFDEQHEWTINQSFVDMLIPILKKTFGAGFLNKALVKKTTVSLKSKEALEELLSSELDEETKTEIKKAIKAPQIAITYPQ